MPRGPGFCVSNNDVAAFSNLADDLSDRFEHQPWYFARQIEK
jgi:hypothetical protein